MKKLINHSYIIAYFSYFVVNSMLCKTSHCPLSLGVGLVLLTMGLITLFMYIINKRNNPPIPCYVVYALVYFLLSSFLNNTTGMSFFSIDCGIWLVSPFCFIVGAYAFSEKVSSNFLFVATIIALVMALPGILVSYSDVGIQSSSAYFYFYSVMPFVFVYLINFIYTKKNNLAYSLIVLLIIMIVLSSKRGALLALLPFFVCITIFDLHINVKTIFTFIIGFGIVYCVIASYFPDQIQFISERFTEDDSENFGSGRSFIWEIVLFDYYNGSMIEWIFGKGVYSSCKLTGLFLDHDYSAHSTYIGLLHDYGLVGVCCFVRLIIGMVIKAWSAIKTQYEYGHIMLSLALTLALVGITEYLFEFYMWFIALYFFWYFARDFDNNYSVKKVNYNEN